MHSYRINKVWRCVLTIPALFCSVNYDTFFGEFRSFIFNWRIFLSVIYVSTYCCKFSKHMLFLDISNFLYQYYGLRMLFFRAGHLSSEGVQKQCPRQVAGTGVFCPPLAEARMVVWLETVPIFLWRRGGWSSSEVVSIWCLKRLRARKLKIGYRKV